MGRKIVHFHFPIACSFEEYDPTNYSVENSLALEGTKET
jgi:hypothetical protein